MAKKFKKVHLDCGSCGNQIDFTVTIKTSNASIFCGKCNEFIRKIPTFKLAPFMETEYKNMIFPFGKYKGVIISTMIRTEEISYLYWVRTDKLWQTMDYNLKQCILRQLDNYTQMQKEGTLPKDNEMREKGRILIDPLDGMKVPEKKFTSDDLPI